MKETKKKIQVSSLVLTIGNKEISLTPEEARELRTELDKVLGETKFQTIYIDRYVPKPWPVTYGYENDWTYRPFITTDSTQYSPIVPKVSL